MATGPFKIKINIDNIENAINYDKSDFRSELQTKYLKALVRES